MSLLQRVGFEYLCLAHIFLGLLYDLIVLNSALVLEPEWQEEGLYLHILLVEVDGREVFERLLRKLPIGNNGAASRHTPYYFGKQGASHTLQTDINLESLTESF